jgi:hypothetical protein
VKHKFGLPEELFEALMRLNDLVPSFAPPSASDRRRRQRSAKTIDRSAVRNEIKRFKQCNITLDDAVETVIANGYPDQYEPIIADRYRKSVARKERPIVQYVRGKVGAVRPGSVQKNLAYLLDSVLSESRPRGPAVADTAHLIKSAGLAAAALGLGRNPFHLRESFFSKLADILTKSKGVTVTATDIAFYFGVYAGQNLVHKDEVTGMLGVHVYIPLDCDDKMIEAEVQRVVNVWRQRRASSSDNDGLIRDTAQSHIAKLRALPSRIKLLLHAGHQVQYRQRFSPGAADAGRGRIDMLTLHLLEELRQILPGITERAVSGAVERALYQLQEDMKTDSVSDRPRSKPTPDR